jgi:hypothetical protein
MTDQLKRMQYLMRYGKQTEAPKFNIETLKESADGRKFAIVKEESKYYIKEYKSTENKPQEKFLKEDFQYVGGFMRKKECEYNSFVNALKHLDENISVINKSVGKKGLIESWNPDVVSQIREDRKESLQREILRTQQIMRNVERINEGKEVEVKQTPTGPKTSKDADPFKEKPTTETAEKENLGSAPDEKEKGKKGDEGYEKVKDQGVATVDNSGQGKKVVDESETLAWNDNKDYMDKSHGTKIGSDAPFTENPETQDGAVAAEDGGEDVDSKTPKGEEVNESLVIDEDFGDENPFGDEEDDVPFSDDDINALDAEEEPMGDEMGDMAAADDTIDADVQGADLDTEVGDSDIEARLSSIEDMLRQIIDTGGVDGAEEDAPIGDDIEGGEEIPADDFGGDGEFGGETEDDDIDECGYPGLVESVTRLVEDKLNDFGKHPAYQKTVMTTPPNKNTKKPGQYDMNDEASLEGEKPYGQKIGDSAPFDQAVVDKMKNDITQEVTKAVTESVMRALKKKK